LTTKPTQPTLTVQLTKNMSKQSDKELAVLTAEGMTVGEWAKMWRTPPWQADMRIRRMEREGVVFSGNVMRNLTLEKFGEERNVEVFAPKAYLDQPVKSNDPINVS